jgi:hypothetical protein
MIKKIVIFSAITVCLLISTSLSAEKSGGKKSGPIAPPRRDVPGKKIPLSRGSLYIPDFFSDENKETVDIVIFFHGAAWCSEQNFYDAGKNAVLVSISVKNYGYPDVFNKAENLRSVIDETKAKMKELRISKKPVGKICLASFSGGYSAIREILKHEEFLPMISDVVLADSLYAPRVKGEKNILEPAAMEPFLKYAKRASNGECTFIFSHLYPPLKEHRSNTTTLSASYLIDGAGAKRKEASEKNSRGAQLLYRSDKGNFHVLGYSGMTTQDHFEHFYALSDLLKESSLSPAASKGRLDGFEKSLHFNEQVKKYIFDPDVKVQINAPAKNEFDPEKNTRIIFFALPNGNSTEWTIGKEVKEGDDWHFGIQHIGAQTRRLREIIKDENIVVVYLEAKRKSWPGWRKNHRDDAALIKKLVESVKDMIPGKKVIVELSSHSGGGSFVFGFINSSDEIPAYIRRISFLDSNYGYSDEDKHGDKILNWIAGDPKRNFVILCYDDRNITFNGKRVVGPTGGTYRKTHKMITRFKKDVELGKSVENDIIRYRDLYGQMDIIIHTNPKNKILHTVLVGDMNGFIHSSTTGSEYENMAGVFNGPLAYEKWIQKDSN